MAGFPFFNFATTMACKSWNKNQTRNWQRTNAVP